MNMKLNRTRLVINLFLIIILNFAFSGLLKAQNNEINNSPCDSLLKSKIESTVMFALAGRIPIKLAQPENPKCEIGKYSFDIVVNNDGEIISAELNKKHSSELSEEFLNGLLNTVKSSSFNDKDNAPSKQKGNITYIFKLKENSN